MFFSLHQAINHIKFQEEEKIATGRDRESMKSLIGNQTLSTKSERRENASRNCRILDVSNYYLRKRGARNVVFCP